MGKVTGNKKIKLIEQKIDYYGQRRLENIREKEQLDSNMEKALNEKKLEIFFCYQSSKDRENLICRAKDINYKPELVKRLEYFFSNWSFEIISEEVINIIEEIEEVLDRFESFSNTNVKKATTKKSFFEKVFKCFTNERE